MRAKITLEVQLDCGCWVGHALRDEGPFSAVEDFGSDEFAKPGKRVSAFFSHASEILGYWFHNRLTMRGHRCELVSPENPNGILPKGSCGSATQEQAAPTTTR